MKKKKKKKHIQALQLTFSLGNITIIYFLLRDQDKCYN